jgi:hypothetical protein
MKPIFEQEPAVPIAEKEALDEVMRFVRKLVTLARIWKTIARDV